MLENYNENENTHIKKIECSENIETNVNLRKQYE